MDLTAFTWHEQATSGVCLDNTSATAYGQRSASYTSFAAHGVKWL